RFLPAKARCASAWKTRPSCSRTIRWFRTWCVLFQRRLTGPSLCRAMATRANNAQKLRLFILAGEPSGDRIAADLLARLRARVELEVSGVGGDEMIGQGLTSLYPMSELAVMGVTDVILNLPKILWRLRQTAREILKSQ